MVKRRGYHGRVSSASWLAARLKAWWTLACLQDFFFFEEGVVEGGRGRGEGGKARERGKAYRGATQRCTRQQGVGYGLLGGDYQFFSHLLD